MKKIIQKSIDGARTEIVYSLSKSSQYFNVKNPIPHKYKSNVVCKCTCPQIECNESYIGEIERRFEECIINHKKPDKRSHIYKHCNENSHFRVWLNNFEIIGRNYSKRIKRKISDAL